jgi:hypothetical protein
VYKLVILQLGFSGRETRFLKFSKAYTLHISKHIIMKNISGSKSGHSVLFVTGSLVICIRQIAFRLSEICKVTRPGVLARMGDTCNA